MPTIALAHRLACSLSLGVSLAACHTGPPPEAPSAPNEAAAIEARVHDLLSAYGGDDPEAVLRLCDQDRIVVFGSDVAEIARGPAALRQMMNDDFKLWKTARFGAPRELDVRQSGDLATAFFDVPFSAGGQREVMVRVATVWHKEHAQWLLTQSSNTVPTVGSSARGLLK